MNNTDLMLARAQIALAFFYGLIFVGIFIFMGFYWNALSKFDVGLLTMFATGAMGQSKDAGNFFFARQRPPTLPDPSTTTVDQTTVVKTLPTAPNPPILPAEPAPTPAPHTGEK